MSTVICSKCELSMKVVRTGVTVIEHFGPDNAIYKLWSADEFVCPSCSTHVVSNFADKPIMDNGHESQEEMLAYAKRQEPRSIRHWFENAKMADLWWLP